MNNAVGDTDAPEPARNLLEAVKLLLRSRESLEAFSSFESIFSLVGGSPEHEISVPIHAPEMVLQARDTQKSISATLQTQTQAQNPEAEILTILQLGIEVLDRDLRETRIEIRRRADKAFNSAVAFGLFGGVLLFVGFLFVIFGMSAVGTATAVGGAVSGLFTTVLGKVYSTENEHLRTILADLQLIGRVRLGLLLCERVVQPKDRDAAILSLVRVLGRGRTTARPK